MTEAARKPGYAKITRTCGEARERGYNYAWVDTCCIDKSSSAELQEAINSIFKWYANSAECYVYLEDLSGLLNDRNGRFRTASQRMRTHFPECVWFTRGWTLQELIAPEKVRFYDSNWEYFGNKAKHLEHLSIITGIGVGILDHSEELSSVSAAARMSWAAARRTSRIHDQAYALLGVFQVIMPMLYGEGSNAFRRLQEEIMKTFVDDSIFAWQARSCSRGCLFADSPVDFGGSHSIVSWARGAAFAMTNRGLSITLPISDALSVQTDETLAMLECQYEDGLASRLALRLRKHPGINDYFV